MTTFYHCPCSPPGPNLSNWCLCFHPLSLPSVLIRVSRVLQLKAVRFYPSSGHPPRISCLHAVEAKVLMMFLAVLYSLPTLISALFPTLLPAPTPQLADSCLHTWTSGLCMCFLSSRKIALQTPTQLDSSLPTGIFLNVTFSMRPPVTLL